MNDDYDHEAAQCWKFWRAIRDRGRHLRRMNNLKSGIARMIVLILYASGAAWVMYVHIARGYSLEADWFWTALYLLILAPSALAVYEEFRPPERTPLWWDDGPPWE